MNTEKYQTIEEKILTIYSGKAEKLAQRKVLFLKNSLRLTMRKLLKNLQEKE
jgi:hypothetical protein